MYQAIRDLFSHVALVALGWSRLKVDKLQGTRTTFLVKLSSYFGRAGISDHRNDRWKQDVINC